MTKKRFKDVLIEFDKAKRNLENEQQNFRIDVMRFMKNKGIPVRVVFFGDSFGLDIDFDVPNWQDVPLKMPLNVLCDFCKEFGCDFEYTNCDGHRWIFSFGGLSVGY